MWYRVALGSALGVFGLSAGKLSAGIADIRSLEADLKAFSVVCRDETKESVETSDLLKNNVCPKRAELVPGACKKNDESFRTDDGGCLEVRTGLAWSARSEKRIPVGYTDTLRAPTSKSHVYAYNADGAVRYCNRSEGGFDDWRAPTDEELKSLAGETRAAAHLGFDAGEFYQSTSTTSEDRPWAPNWINTHTYTWTKLRRLADGEMMYSDPESLNGRYVVCVRKRTSRPAPPPILLPPR